MVDPQRPRYWKTATYSVLVVAAVALAAALAMVFRVLGMVNEAVGDEKAREMIGLTSMMAGILLIFALFCLGLLLIRYASFRAVRHFKRSATPFVNAWELAGKRFELTDENDPEPDEETKRE